MNQINIPAFLKALLFFACAAVLLCTFIILPPFKTLEQSELTRNLDRCQATFQSDINALKTLSRDWAEWDDTYIFVQNGNESFITDNLGWDYLNDEFKIHTLYVINLEGRVIWGDSSHPSSARFPQAALDLMRPQGAIYQSVLAGEPVSGVFPSTGGYWMLSANKITQSSGEDPINGILMMGKFLSPDYFSNLSARLKLDISLVLNQEDKKAVTIQGDPVSSQWRPLDSTTAQAFRQIDDLAETSSTSIVISVPREVYRQGVITAWLCGALLTTVGVIIALLWARLTDKSIQLETSNARLIAQDRDILKSERKIRAILNNQHDAIFLHPLLPNGFAHFSEVNNRAIDLYGYSREEFLQLTVSDIALRSDDTINIQSKARQELNSKGSTSFEVVHIKKSGQEFPVEINTSYIDLDDQTFVLSSVRDIGKRKKQEQRQLKLEEQLRQKHKMEALGFMAGGMAHNFNNNLSIILGNIELSQMKQDPDSESVKLLENAKIAILRSRDLVKKIITYSRQGTQTKALIQLTDVITESMELLQSTLPTSVRLSQEIAPQSANTVINADFTQVQETLINLCNNAVHALNEQGELTILLDTIELKSEDIPAQYEAAPGSFAKLSVQDNGCGIAAEDVSKVFDPFYTTKAAHEGAGMGLATVQGIMIKHGGVIKVNSVLEHGTIFDLYFPLVDQRASENEAKNGEVLKGTEKILYVDDDKMVAQMSEKILKAMGYQVTTMTNSVEALKLFTNNADHFDMVITDQTMPELTGKELITKLREIRPDISTILITGHSNLVDERQAKQQGIDAFCLKPLDSSELSQTIRQVLESDKQESL